MQNVLHYAQMVLCSGIGQRRARGQDVRRTRKPYTSAKLRQRMPTTRPAPISSASASTDVELSAGGRVRSPGVDTRRPISGGGGAACLAQRMLNLTKVGSGNLTLSGTNYYTGVTIVSNGTLEVDGVLGAGAVTVQNGGTLDGAGVIAGPVAVNSGGALAAGDVSGVGALSIANTLTLNPGAATTLRINQAAATNDSSLLCSCHLLDAVSYCSLFCKRMAPLPWSPPSTETRRLRTLTRRLQDLKDMRQQERNRLEGAQPEMRASIRRMLDSLKEELDLVQRQIDEVIHQYPELSAQVKLLASIKGIGKHTACVLLAEIGNLSQFQSARELAAYAGLVPRKETSGTSINRPARMMKAGNVILRKALFMPALVAAKHNPLLFEVYQRLTSKGKTKMSAIGAVMRRLLHIVFGVLTHHTPFNPAYVSIAH